MPEAKGSCLCGAVSFSVNDMKKEFSACHCNMCQKWTGGPLLNVYCGSDVMYFGEENISVYDSSLWAERGFCKTCGSSLFYRIKSNKLHHIPLGLFEDKEGMEFSMQLFIDKKPSSYSFAEKTVTMTQKEIFVSSG